MNPFLTCSSLPHPLHRSAIRSPHRQPHRRWIWAIYAALKPSNCHAHTTSSGLFLFLNFFLLLSSFREISKTFRSLQGRARPLPRAGQDPPPARRDRGRDRPCPPRRLAPGGPARRHPHLPLRRSGRLTRFASSIGPLFE